MPADRDNERGAAAPGRPPTYCGMPLARLAPSWCPPDRHGLFFERDLHATAIYRAMSEAVAIEGRGGRSRWGTLALKGSFTLVRSFALATTYYMALTRDNSHFRPVGTPSVAFFRWLNATGHKTCQMAPSVRTATDRQTGFISPSLFAALHCCHLGRLAGRSIDRPSSLPFVCATKSHFAFPSFLPSFLPSRQTMTWLDLLARCTLARSAPTNRSQY